MIRSALFLGNLGLLVFAPEAWPVGGATVQKNTDLAPAGLSPRAPVPTPVAHGGKADIAVHKATNCPPWVIAAFKFRSAQTRFYRFLIRMLYSNIGPR